MNTSASRLLRSTSSFSASSSSSNLLTNAPAPPALPLAPLAAGAVPRALEEELEAQARSALALFGFGVDSVNWSPAALPDGGSTAGLGVGVRLAERVAPLNANSLLWRSVTKRDGNSSSNSDENARAHGNSSGLATSGSSSSLANDEDLDADWEPLGGVEGGAKVLQQYLVKCVAVLPTAAIEEVVELLIRSDRDDMEPVMQQLVGAKVSGSGFVYRRRKRRVRVQPPVKGERKREPLAKRRQNLQVTAESTTSSARSTTVDFTDDDEEDSSDSDDDEAVEVSDDLTTLNVGLPTSISNPGAARASTNSRRITRMQSLDSITTASSSASSANHNMGHANSWSSMSSPQKDATFTSPAPSSSATYMDGYRRAMARSGHQGNLSIKWVVGEKPSRMFGSRATYCLLDYECELVNDWDVSGPGTNGIGEPSPMYVRVLRSCYLPQCQPWLDELGGRPRNIQPVGIMVRQISAPLSKRGKSELLHAPAVEVQLVASILEKPQLPASSRRAKLRALCARLSRIEEVITSRRLSHSLLTTQPLWVNDRERPGCRACGARFGFSRRRHHCRICGEICCAECCPKVDLALPEVGSTSVRVCVSCRHSQRRKSTETPVMSRNMGGTPTLSSPASTSAMTPRGVPPPDGMPLRRTTSTGSATPVGGLSPPSRDGKRPLPPPPPPTTPTMMTPPIMVTPTQLQHHQVAGSASPSTDNILSSSSSYGSVGSGLGSSMERKQSLASSVFHKLKSSTSLS